VTRRQGRRRKKLLDDLKDRRGYCELKEEVVDRTMWRNCFARGFGPAVWQITDDDDILSVFSLQNAVCFIILTYLVPVLCTFYIQRVLKLKKNNSGAKTLTVEVTPRTDNSKR